MNEYELIANIGTVQFLSVSNGTGRSPTQLTANITGTLSLYKKTGKGGGELKHLILRNNYGSTIFAEDGFLSVDEELLTFKGIGGTYKFRKISEAPEKDPEEKRGEWKCLHCGKSNGKNTIYCEACRTPRKDHEVICKYCHSMVSVTERRCPGCNLGTRHSIITDWLNRYDRPLSRARKKVKRSRIYSLLNTVLLIITVIGFLLTYRPCHGITPAPTGIAMLHSILIGIIPLLSLSEVLLVRLHRRCKAAVTDLMEHRLFDEADTDDFMPYYRIRQSTKKEI